MPETRATLYVGTNSMVVVSGLYDHNAEAFVNNATVRITLLDSNNSEVSGETWPVTGNYVTDSDGRYHVLLDTDADITAGNDYIIKLEVLVSVLVVSTTYIEVVALEDRR